MPVSPKEWDLVSKDLNNGVKVLRNLSMTVKRLTPDHLLSVGTEIHKEGVNQLNKMVYDTPERGYSRTGALRRSGRFKLLGRNAVRISFGGTGTGVDYSVHVHEGTSRIESRPFLTAAIAKLSKLLKSFAGIDKATLNRMRAYKVRVRG